MRRHLVTILAAVVAASATSFALAQANRPEATTSAASNADIYRAVKTIRARARTINIRVKRIDARTRRMETKFQNLGQPSRCFPPGPDGRTCCIWPDGTQMCS